MTSLGRKGRRVRRGLGVSFPLTGSSIGTADRQRRRVGEPKAVAGLHRCRGIGLAPPRPAPLQDLGSGWAQTISTSTGPGSDQYERGRPSTCSAR